MAVEIVKMSDKEYHAIEAYSNSAGKDLRISPKHFKSKEHSDSSAKRVGSAFHAYLLSPQTIEDEYIIYTGKTKTLETKEGLKFITDNPTKFAITKEELAQGKELAYALPEYMRNYLISKTNNEFAIIGDIDGIPVKCKIDAYSRGNQLIYDPKSTRGLVHQFPNTMVDYGYHSQAYFYTLMAKLAGLKVKDFVFLVVEKAAPHGFKGVVCSDMMFELGKIDTEIGLNTYGRCYKSGNWDEMYSDDFLVAELPYYLQNKVKNTNKLTLVK